mmetsp:Transcript_31580/g.69364  ORF Transcript_31580/g.69364 Transcript_31580/m.69364 type:complete len:546 (-) Transcript_31580:188-1825(-)
MSPKEHEDDADWTTVDYEDGQDGAGNGNGRAVHVDQPAPAPAPVPVPVEQGQAKAAEDPLRESAVQEAEDEVGALDLSPDEAPASSPPPTRSTTVDTCTGTSSSAAAEGEFYEGDKVMYIADGSSSSNSNAEAVKARIVSATPPNYEIILPASSDSIKVPMDHPGLLSLDEYETRQLQREVGQLDIVSSELYGGQTGGGPFDDLVLDLVTQKARNDGGGGGTTTTTSSGSSGGSSAEVARTLTEICIRSGSVVDGIGATYSDGSTTYYGGDGGGTHRLILKSGEYITEATVRYGKVVQEVTFKTNTGRQLGPKGGSGGLILGLTSEVVTVRAPGRFYALAAIYGRFGKYLDAIGFHWAPVAAAAESDAVQNNDIVTNLSKQHLKTTEFYGSVSGGVGGDSDFDDGHFNIRVTDVTITTHRGGPVRGVSIRYYTGRVSAYGGGKSKTGRSEETSMKLDKGEHVTEVHVRHNDSSVISLTFVTNKGARFGPCGMIPDKDKDTDCWDNCRDSIAIAPIGYMLIGIKGQEGQKRLNSIGFNWSPAPKGE